MIRAAIVISIRPKIFAADIQYRDTDEKQFGVKIAGRAYQNLQVNDYVIVGYLDDSTSDPVILDKVLVTGDPLLGDDIPKIDPDDPDSAVDADSIKMLHTIKNSDGEVTGQIMIQSDKDGKLTIEMSGNLGEINLVAKGNRGDVNIKSSGSTHIEAVDTVTVNATGKITVSTEDDIKVTAGGKVEIEGGSSVELGDNLAKQLINNYPNCLFSGAPHAVGNTKAKV